MAVVLDSLTALASRTVFLKPTDMVRELTPIPRAIVNFDLLNGVISAKPLNDTAELIVGMTLDSSFAYRMVEASASLTVDVAKDWNNLTYLEITNGIRNLAIGSTQRHGMIKSSGTRIPVPTEIWMLPARQDVPTYIIQALTATATPIVTFKASNDTAAAGAAGTFNCHFSFLEYDIEQAERYPIHYPVLTYGR